MPNLDLYSYQLDAIDKLKNGSILCGGVGSGKSRTSLAYYYIKVCRGSLKINGQGENRYPLFPRDLYIITTAKKRDSKEWEYELTNFIFKENTTKRVNKKRRPLFQSLTP